MQWDPSMHDCILKSWKSKMSSTLMLLQMLAKSRVAYADSDKAESGIENVTGSHSVLQPGSGISHVSTKYYRTQGQ